MTNTNKTFVLSDESLNSHGYWVKTDGIDLKRFKKNPVMLFNHATASSSRPNIKEILTPIGKWENVRVENGKLLAEACFNEKDEFALKIKQAVNDGFIKMASIGATPIEYSTDKIYLKKGQTKATVLKAELVECSIVIFGANAEALALTLALYESGDIESNKIDNNQTLINMNTEKIALSLGLVAEATEEDILLKIENIKKDNEVIRLASINELVDLSIKNGQINESQRNHFVALGTKTSREDLAVTLEAFPKAKRPTDFINNSSNKGTNTLSFGDMSDTQKLMLKKENPSEFEKLMTEYYSN